MRIGGAENFVAEKGTALSILRLTQWLSSHSLRTLIEEKETATNGGMMSHTDGAAIFVTLAAHASRLVVMYPLKVSSVSQPLFEMACALMEVNCRTMVLINPTLFVGYMFMFCYN